MLPALKEWISKEADAKIRHSNAMLTAELELPRVQWEAWRRPSLEGCSFRGGDRFWLHPEQGTVIIADTYIALIL